MTYPTVSNLEDHLGYWLRLVSNSVSHGFARKVEAEGVTVAEWVFLRALYDSDRLSPTRLAEQMGMTRGAITRLADRLIAKALVARTAAPTDKRAQTLALTPAGRAKVPTLARLADENDADYFGRLPPDERQALDAALQKIVAQHGLHSVPTD